MQVIFDNTDKMALERALYIVATPIGNMEDITLRALKVLNSCDHIFCEDTRVSYKLLKFYDMAPKNLGIYNDNSDSSQRSRIVEIIENGSSVVLICDAGTPAIADPGFKLKQKCRENNIKIIPIAGSSACAAAISAACIGSDRFFFSGFLPAPLDRRKRELGELLGRSESVICFESPLRLITTLKIIVELDNKRVICVARELTKIFEDIRTETADEMLEYYSNKFPNGRVKGEIVLLLEKNTEPTGVDLNDLDNILAMSLKYLSVKNSAELFSEVFHLAKKKLYSKLLFLKEERG
ncbi:MAG: 16S rRNA (cytidine(1402)-2'-O)-methyltransferase [Rickettsiales bacterium]|jgi:16S rRNA (cytidine1402-2'-O)-methyltransferase|nr:16S rRNA (cytidine(1402)-2'-O)-methyltransferase [Rickettsiales bacterium]